MRRSLYISLIAVICTLPLTLSAFPHKLSLKVSAGGSPPQSATDRRQGNHDKEREFYRQRGLQNGRSVAPDAYDRAIEQWRKSSRAVPGGGGRPAAPSTISSLMGTVWVPIGPSPVNQGTSKVNGRVSAIAVSPSNPLVIYQGSSGGGLWRTIDGGATWTPLYDQQASLGTGEPSSVAIDPNDTNTIYVGTSGRFVLNISKGILKSTDGGGSWIILGSNFPSGNVGNADNLFSGQWVNTIVVDPSNSSALYLAATNGLYRSTDSGQNWSQGTNGGGDSRSLVLDTSTPPASRILYAGINGNGIRRSTDSGLSWNQVLNSATPAVATAIAALPGVGPSINNVVAALAPPTSPANPAGVQVLYCALGVCTGNPGGTDVTLIFRSTDQGATWNQQPAAGGPGGSQCGYDLEMGVDPASPGDGSNDTLYVGAVGQVKSTDSGATFSPTGNGQHVDSHSAWVFFKRPAPNPSYVYTGNDGGIWRSTDGGATWTGTGLPGAPPTINGGGLQTGLFYNLDVKRDATASVSIGSLQDNGQVRGTGSLAWVDTHGGDGWDVGFDWINNSEVYASSGFWSPAPCTRVWKSPNSGSTWGSPGLGAGPGSEVTPWGTTSDQGCYLAPIKTDPSNAGFVYVSGSQNLWQSTDGGSNWRIIRNFGGTGQIDVAKANANNVVFANGNQVFVSTNALAATVGPPSGVTFTNITRNLPIRTVNRVAFDPNDPAVIYGVLGGFNNQTPGQPGHVFRTTIGGTSWTDISPSVDVSYSALALDGGPAPTAIYVGNDLGVMRSVDGGASWAVLDDVHFPNVPVTDLEINTQAGVLRAATFGRGVFEFAAPSGPVIAINAQNGLQFGNVCSGAPGNLLLQVFNVGTSNLTINSVQRLFGSSDFTVLGNPSTPLIISPNAEVDFTVQFNPTTAGSQTAQIRISSNDPSAPAFDLFATGAGATGTIDTLIADTGNFGNVCVGSFKDLPLTINNSGACDLSVTNITSSSGEFQVAGVMAFPVVIHAGGNLQVPIRLQPTTAGAKSANITVTSNDPATPSKIVAASGNAPDPNIATVIANSGSFGDVCIGSFKDLNLTISNTGGCDLSVSNITSSSPEFQTASVMSFPLVVPAGGNVQVPIRFQPTSLGAKSATITVTSNDPDTPSKAVNVTGNVPPGDIRVTGSTNFGDVCAGVLAEKTISVCNVGLCNLTVSSVAFDPPCADFTIINNPFPAVVSHDSCLNVVIRFTPTSAGPKSCTLKIFSDDPDTPVVILTVTANTPLASIDVPPDVSFPPTVIQSIGPCLSLRPFPISNTGTCDLKITSIAISGPEGSEYSLVGLPSYPIILQPGHIVGEGNLRIAFAPTVIDRDRIGTITVTYESDPITHATMTVTRNLCGEGVRTGARVLVTVGGSPTAMVEKIHLQRITGNRNKDILDTVDVAQNLPLVTVTPGAPCVGFQYHREYGTVSNPIQLLPGSYQVTVTTLVNGRRRNKSVGFEVNTCTFNPTIIVGF